MGLDNRLIAMSGEVPNFAADFIGAQAQGMKVGAAKQEMAQRNKLAQLMAAKPKGMPVSTYLESQGMGAQALEYGKQEADISKTQADTSKAALEGHIKQLDIAARVAQGFLSQPQLSKQAILDGAQQYAQQGIIKPEDFQGMQQKLSALPDDDATLRQFLNQAVQSGMDAKDKLTIALQQSQQAITSQNNLASQDLRAKEFDLNQQKFGLDQQQFSETQGNNAFERKYKVAGLERNRANDEFSQSIDSKKYQLELDKYNNPAKASKPTEAQSKAALYANRMQESENILSSIDYSPAALGTKEALSNTPVIGGMLGAGANIALSKESQQAEQAQRNFINATLRRESGAVISEQEFANGKKQYFPAVGDSPEVLAQKKQNRQTAIEALQAESQGTIPSMSKPSSGQSWDDNTIIKQYGGTPEQLAKYKAMKGIK